MIIQQQCPIYLASIYFQCIDKQCDDSYEEKYVKPSWEIHALTLPHKSDTCAIKNMYIFLSCRVEIVFHYRLPILVKISGSGHVPMSMKQIEANSSNSDDMSVVLNSLTGTLLPTLKLGFMGFKEFGSGRGPLPQPPGFFLFFLKTIYNSDHTTLRLCNTYTCRLLNY